MLIWLRSWAYLIAFVAWTLVASLLFLPALVSRAWTLRAIRAWVRGIMTLARVIAGITYRVVGREHLPRGACIVAAQHQASFETYLLFLVLDQPVFVLKRELIAIPLIGWYMSRAGLVNIDRSAGAAAMRKTLRAAQVALADGRQVVIFPEGTRTPPGVVQPYRPGVAALYLHCRVPVVPAALNSHYTWGKTRILKRPGLITIAFLPPLPTGLDRDAMLAELRTRIDSAEVDGQRVNPV